MNQRTLKNPFTLRGVGIHSGALGSVRVHPAEENTGRLFHVGSTTFPARADYVIDTRRCTTLGAEGARISTVEHLLSALQGCNIDNAILEVEGPEIPILDGSALPFFEAILEAGIQEQNSPPKRFKALEGFEIAEGDACLSVVPFEGYSIEVTTTFDYWEAGAATVAFTLSEEMPTAYHAEIAPARTYAFDFEVKALLEAGLAQGGSLDNALIIVPPKDFSTPLRLPQEWCRHKILDVLGDLALLNARPQMRLTALRPGHRLNAKLTQALLAHPSSFFSQESA